MQTESMDPELKIVEPSTPEFRLWNSIPDGTSSQLENAVRDFMVSSHLPEGVDTEGFYNQTLQAIASASYLNQGGDLWLGFMRGRLVAYILGRVGVDYDGKLSYTVTQAWVRKDQRGQKWVKWAWEKVRQRAKNCMCSHFAIFSTRGNDAAYCRFLGKGFHFYSSVLKEEI